MNAERFKHADPSQASTAASVIARFSGPRDKTHLVLREDDYAGSKPREYADPNLPFWPTSRERLHYGILPQIERCQRCGVEITPGIMWWCWDCLCVADHLQAAKCKSMVMLAHSGEYDPIEPDPDIVPKWMFDRHTQHKLSDLRAEMLYGIHEDPILNKRESARRSYVRRKRMKVTQ